MMITSPSRRALATRSLTEATRLTGQQRRQALAVHAATVWSTKPCTLVSRTSRV